MFSLLTFVWIAIVLLFIAGIIGIGIATWSTTPTTMVPGFYIWTIGNGTDPDFATSSPIEYPYVLSGKQVSINFMVTIPVTALAHASLPILFSLPIPGTSLVGDVIFSSHSLPVNQTSITPVLYDASHFALQYHPSGSLATGAELTTSWTLIIHVIYNTL